MRLVNGERPLPSFDEPSQFFAQRVGDEGVRVLEQFLRIAFAPVFPLKAAAASA